MSGADTCSIEAGTLLAILQQYDKLRVVFDRWSVRRKSDRDVLSIVLKPGGALGHEFMSALIRAFPFRIVGPFLCNGSLDIEILDRGLPHDAAETPPEISIFGAPERKRKRNDKLGAARAALAHEAAAVNGTTSAFAAVRDGLDASGVWVECELHAAERTNLCFMHTAMVLDACENVKTLVLELRAAPTLVLREYGDDERRISTGWDLVVAFKREGSFQAVRRVTRFAGSAER